MGMNFWSSFWWAAARAWKFARKQRIEITRQQTRAFDRGLVVQFKRYVKDKKKQR